MEGIFMKKNVIKRVIASVCVVATVVGGVLVYKESASGASKIKYTEDMKVVPTMSDEIGPNSVWCGTFQLVWNEMKHNYAKRDIVFEEMFPMVENLNKEEFTKEMLSDEYYYINYGVPTIELKEEIENAIKEKFGQNSDVLDQVDWNGDKNRFISYSMLYREFEFEHKFDVLENGKFADSSNDVRYFGIGNDTKDKVGNQVDVLYYNDEDDFAIVIYTKSGDELVFCKNPEGKTYNEIYNNMKAKASSYEGNSSFAEKDVLKVPFIDFAKMVKYTELQNKPFMINNPDYDYNVAEIDTALQTVMFKLDEKGGRIKSEAIMLTKDACFIEEEKPRQFYIDDNFVLFLREEGKEMPYFAMNVEDIEEFQ